MPPLRPHLSGIITLLSLVGESLTGVITPLVTGSFPEREVLLRQILFTAIQPLWLILAVSTLIGTATLAQLVSIAGSGSGFLAGKIMVWVVARELAPLIVSLIVIARSGSAIAAEISQMKIGGELELLEMQGISVPRYLIGPRLLATTTSLLLLTIYFSLSAIAGGWFVASISWHIPFDPFRQGIFSVLTLAELSLLFIKSFLLGIGIGSICCHQGLSVGSSVTQIPQATTRGVMYSLLWVFVVEMVLSLLLAAGR